MLNQLIKTTTLDSKVIINTYNGEGKRVAKDVNGSTTRYLYKADKVILELNGDGSEKARNVHGTSLISRTVDDLVGYYFYNGHGDVTVIQDVYGNQLALYYYDAFGNSETVQESVYGSVYNTYTYAGYMWDVETGLYYLMARYYDPITARFLQEDTYRGNPEDILSLNLYTYCHNEPVMYIHGDGSCVLTMFTIKVVAPPCVLQKKIKPESSLQVALWLSFCHLRPHRTVALLRPRHSPASVPSPAPSERA